MLFGACHPAASMDAVDDTVKGVQGGDFVDDGGASKGGWLQHASPFTLLHCMCRLADAEHRRQSTELPLLHPELQWLVFTLARLHREGSLMVPRRWLCGMSDSLHWTTALYLHPLLV
jgi:hypothetical protein